MASRVAWGGLPTAPGLNFLTWETGRIRNYVRRCLELGQVRPGLQVCRPRPAPQPRSPRPHAHRGWGGPSARTQERVVHRLHRAARAAGASATPAALSSQAPAHPGCGGGHDLLVWGHHADDASWNGPGSAAFSPPRAPGSVGSKQGQAASPLLGHPGASPPHPPARRAPDPVGPAPQPPSVPGRPSCLQSWGHLQLSGPGHPCFAPCPSLTTASPPPTPRLGPSPSSPEVTAWLPSL